MLVGRPHGAAPKKSNQYLVTIDLQGRQILASVPVSRDLMGPLVVSQTAGLLTFGSDRYAGMTSLNWKTGAQAKFVEADFGTVYLFMTAFSAESTFAVNLYPSPTRFFVVDTSTTQAHVQTNVTFNYSVHALAAAW